MDVEKLKIELVKRLPTERYEHVLTSYGNSKKVGRKYADSS